MKNLLELIKALTPLMQGLTPVWILLAGYWINKQTKKTTTAVAAAQTTELKAHSDDNREKITSAVVSATGTHKALTPDHAP